MRLLTRVPTIRSGSKRHSVCGVESKPQWTSKRSSTRVTTFCTLDYSADDRLLIIIRAETEII